MKLRERRDSFRKGLSGLYTPIYDGLCDNLGPEWQPFYGLREFDLQDHLFQIGRTLPGKIVTNARGGESAHNYGCASDWTIWDQNGQPIWIKETDPKWKEFSQVCEKVGGDWGGHFPLVDYPHVQLSIKTPWKNLRGIWMSQGLPAAMQYIRENMC